MDQGDSGSLIVHLDAEEGGPVRQTQPMRLVTSLILEDPLKQTWDEFGFYAA